MLCQLSYSPDFAGEAGLEPATLDSKRTLSASPRPLKEPTTSIRSVSTDLCQIRDAVILPPQITYKDTAGRPLPSA